MQEPDSGTSLKPDGSNVTSVLKEIERQSKDDFERISDVLATIVPNTKRVHVKKHGKNLSLEFTQEWGEKKRLNFEGFSMSDGTLRAIGLPRGRVPAAGALADRDRGARGDDPPRRAGIGSRPAVPRVKANAGRAHDAQSGSAGCEVDHRSAPAHRGVDRRRDPGRAGVRIRRAKHCKSI